MKRLHISEITRRCFRIAFNVLVLLWSVEVVSFAVADVVRGVVRCAIGVVVDVLDHFVSRVPDVTGIHGR